jgi:hypothetical protein
LSIQERENVIVSLSGDECSRRWVSLVVVAILEEKVASIARTRAYVKRWKCQGVLGPQVGV